MKKGRMKRLVKKKSRSMRLAMSRKMNLFRLVFQSWIETAFWEVVFLHLVFLSLATWTFDNYLYSLWGPYWLVYHHPLSYLVMVGLIGTGLAIRRFQTTRHPYHPPHSLLHRHLQKRRTIYAMRYKVTRRAREASFLGTRRAV